MANVFLRLTIFVERLDGVVGVEGVVGVGVVDC
jgi:hypothetical protein